MLALEQAAVHWLRIRAKFKIPVNPDFKAILISFSRNKNKVPLKCDKSPFLFLPAGQCKCWIFMYTVPGIPVH